MNKTKQSEGWLDAEIQSRSKSSGKPPWVDYNPRSNSDLYADTPELELWRLDQLRELEETFNLDNLPPEAVYYLGKLSNRDGVTGIYIRDDGRDGIELLTVIPSRDYDLMDEVYDIEMEVLDLFRNVNIDFRVIMDPNSSTLSGSGVYPIFERN